VTAPTFLFDENFPPAIPTALRLFAFDTVHTLDQLARGTPDEEIFAFLAARGWYWVSHDRRVVRNPHQRAALITAGIGAFILIGRVHRTTEQMMAFMVTAMGDLVRCTTTIKRPFVIGITDRRKLERLA